MASSRDINLAITGEDLTKPATDSAARNFDNLQRKVDKFSTDKPSKETEAFARLVTSNLKDGESAFQSIQKEIVNTKTRITEMRRSFATTGSQGLFGDIKKSEADLKVLQTALSAMVVEGEKVGEAVGGTLTSGISAGAQDLPQLFTPQGAIGAGVIASVAVSLVPVLIGAMAGAVTAGVGVGVLGAGALIEKNSPAVQSAFAHLKADAVATFSDAASPLEQPFVDALQYVDELVQHDGPELKKMFAAVAPAVGLIVHGLGDLADDALPTVVRLAGNFTAAFEDPGVQNELKILGSQVLQIMNTFAQNPDVAKDFFSLFLFGLNLVIAPLNVAVKGVQLLDDAFHKLVLPPWMNHDNTQLIKFNQDATDAAGGFDALGGALGSTNPIVQTSSQIWQQNAQSVGLAADGVDAYRQAVADTILGAMMSADRATLGWNESLTNLSKTLKTNKVNLDLHKAAGQADRESILNAVQANIEIYDSMMKSGIGAKDAAAAYDDNFKALENLPGLTDKQQRAVDGLIGKYKKVPDKVTTETVLTGLDTTLKNLTTVLKKIYGIPDVVSTTVKIHVDQSQYSKVNKQLAHLNGGHALEAAMSWSPIGHDITMAGAAPSGVTEAARPVTLNSSITSVLTLNGRVLDSQTQRVINDNYRVQRVGSRR